MHLKITHIFMFEFLFFLNIVYLYLKDWEAVQKKKREENAFSNREAVSLLESIFSFHLMIKPQVVFNREIFPRDWSTNTFEIVSLTLHTLAWEQRACPYLSFLC